jgi:hypothetical protein
MKRDKRTIDEIFRQYLPAVSEEEVTSAGEAVLLRLQEEMQDGIEEFKYPEPEFKLRKYESLLLVAVSLHHDQGYFLQVCDKAAELAGRRLPSIPLGIAFARLQEKYLIEEWWKETPKLSGKYRLTPRGERALAEARVLVEERLPGRLEDLI